ncbi:hypothetical protein DB354_14000 [Opitutus sp. ER46]|nr:hypothetical protein DB354_14000 [Opitutus sp. ER46]
MAGGVRGAEPAIIGKARAYLGPEAALNSVRTLHYIGTVVTTDPADPKKETRAAVEILLEKPDRQRVTITTEAAIEATGLDGYDAWTRTTSTADRSKWSQTLLGADQIKRLRANTWEHMAFFRGLEQRGGRVEDLGTATVDGIACRKVAFIHQPNIIFYRYFDIAGGRVVYSETDAGVTIREQGEIYTNGIRFPKSIITVQKNASGQSQTVALTFDRVIVNEPFAPEVFAVPALLSR